MRRIIVENEDLSSLSRLITGTVCHDRSAFERAALALKEDMVIEIRNANGEVIEALEAIQQKSKHIYLIRG